MDVDIEDSVVTSDLKLEPSILATAAPLQDRRRRGRGGRRTELRNKNRTNKRGAEETDSLLDISRSDRILVKWTDSPKYICNRIMGALTREGNFADSVVQISGLEGAIVIALGRL